MSRTQTQEEAAFSAGARAERASPSPLPSSSQVFSTPGQIHCKRPKSVAKAPNLLLTPPGRACFAPARAVQASASAIALRARYAVCGTELCGVRYCATAWCYAVCGTELAYAPTQPRSWSRARSSTP
eukprot:3498910-Rhodomonas_salina.1